MAMSKVFILKSCDGESFEVDETVLRVSETIKNMIEDGCVDGVILLPNVSSQILPKVIEYCKKHVRENGFSKTSINGDEKREEDEREKTRVEKLKKWEAEYMDIDQQVLYHLMLAAKYLEIKGLLDLTMEKVASMIRGKNPDQVRKILDIKNDFTPEEEAEKFRNKESAWAFD